MAQQKQKSEKLKEVLEQTEGQIDIIITQFDPDAIAAALGLRQIINFVRGKEEENGIYYAGGIGHPQNRCIINKYDLKRKMKHVSEAETFNNVALVDSSKMDDGRLETGTKIDPLIVVDHHRGSNIKSSPKKFVYVEEVGSSSTLIIELMQELGIEFSEENYLPTLLALGIHTDTKALVSGTKRDRHAYGYITNFVSPMEFSQILHYPLPESHYTNLQRALNKMTIKGSRIIANAGNVSESDADDLASIADYLIRMDGISLVVVWGIVGKKIRISARSSDITNPLEDFLKEKFGPKSGAKLSPEGTGEGGAVIDFDLGFWYSAKTRETVEKLAEERLEEVMFADQTLTVAKEESKKE